MRTLLKRLCVLLLALMLSDVARAESYPSRTITMVVPFPPGGAVDVLTRSITDHLSRQYKVPVIVENRVGAGGNIATAQVARAAPDGYTLVAGTVGTHAINAALYPNLPFDPVTHFKPITMNAVVPNILLVHPEVPAKTLDELIAYAKANPGSLSYASAGLGTPTHLAAEMLRSSTGIEINHVPYRGAPQATTDLISGRVKMFFNNLTSALPFMQTGQVRPIAVTTPNRSPAAPHVPTMKEAGLFNYEVVTWYGFFAPAGTPDEIVKKLHRDIVAALSAEDVKKVYDAQGAEIVGNSPEEFGKALKVDVTKWADVVKRAGVKLE